MREIVRSDTSKVEVAFLTHDRRSLRAAKKLEADETILSIGPNYLLTLDRVQANSIIGRQVAELNLKLHHPKICIYAIYFLEQKRKPVLY